MSKLLSFISLFILIFSYAQDDLLKEIDTVKTEEPYSPSFKALQVVTAQSTKLPARKEFYLDISHRFGDVSDGFKNFFGLDNATTKLGIIYGLRDWLALSASRHTYQKTYEFGAKYRLFKQEKSHCLILSATMFWISIRNLKKMITQNSNSQTDLPTYLNY
jgi:hypothetical protein